MAPTLATAMSTSVFEAVAEIDGDPVARAHARRLQSRRDAMRLLVQAAERDPVAIALDEGPAGVQRSFLAQPTAEGPAGPVIIASHWSLESGCAARRGSARPPVPRSSSTGHWCCRW